MHLIFENVVFIPLIYIDEMHGKCMKSGSTHTPWYESLWNDLLSLSLCPNIL